MTCQTTRVVLAERPVGEPTDASFRVETAMLPEPSDGQVLLRTVYLSLDPYMRGRMSAAKSYAPPVPVGDTMVGGTVSQVVQSCCPELKVGMYVLAEAGWQTHSIAEGSAVTVLNPADAPLSTALGVRGMPGFTAYSGLLKIGQPQPGETVVVAAASGPVGSAVGQIAKIRGARAVGIAGGPRKCAHLIDELGFDAAVDRHDRMGRPRPHHLSRGLRAGARERAPGICWSAAWCQLRQTDRRRGRRIARAWWLLPRLSVARSGEAQRVDPYPGQGFHELIKVVVLAQDVRCVSCS
jgi:NADPH-dependent curcumin reductase CurA